MTFYEAFCDEIAKIAYTQDPSDPIKAVKNIIKSEPLFQLGRSPVLRGIARGTKAAGKGVVSAVRGATGEAKRGWKRLTEGGPKSQEMLKLVRKAAREGR